MVFCAFDRSGQTLPLKAKHRTQLVLIQQVDRHLWVQPRAEEPMT